MSDSNNNPVVAISPLQISDEEIATSSFEQLLAKYGDNFEASLEENENNDPEEESEENEEGEDPEMIQEEELESEKEASEEPENEEEQEESEEETDVDNEESKDNNSEELKALKEIKDKIFAPFKANGKELKVDSVEQAISLMQMGANYTQKMTQLKSELKTVEMLKKAGLTDTSKLNFLIDISKGDPKAIAKLIKDTELDVRLLDADEAESYKESDHSISDEQYEFQRVTQELQNDPELKYSEMLTTVSKFDQASKNYLYSNPATLAELADHYKDGTYSKVMDEVERRRILGDTRLANMPTLEAYVTVGNELAAKEANKPKANVVASKVVKPKVQQNVNKQIVSKTASTGGKVKTNSNAVDFLAMSDEEFAAFEKANKLVR